MPGPVELPGDPENTPKGQGNYYNPPGGNPGGGPGPGFGGGVSGGSGALLGGSPGGRGFMLSPFRRLGVNQMMQSEPGQDTIPAMLSPGEFVVNSQAAQHPAISQLLMMLNQGGAQPQQGTGYAGGGYVANQTPSVDEIYQWLHQSLLGSQQPLHMAYGGFVPSFGQPQQATHSWDRPGGWGSGSPSMGNAGMNRPPTSPMLRSPDSPTGPTAPPGTGQNGSWGGNYNYDASGRDQTYFNGLYDMLNKFNAGGTFSPGGSQQYMGALGEQAKANSDALTRRAMLGADVYGMDPSQAGATHLQALMGTNRDTGDALTNAYAGLLGNQQNFAQQMQGNAFNFNAQDQNAINNFLRQWQLPDHGVGQQGQSSTNWGGLAGTAIGAGIGALASNPKLGASLGAIVGSGFHK